MTFDDQAISTVAIVTQKTVTNPPNAAADAIKLQMLHTNFLAATCDTASFSLVISYKSAARVTAVVTYYCCWYC